jgi:xylan 1,4-beta-xylosidase
MTESSTPTSAQFKWNLKGTSEPFPHFWEHTVGSGHATLALRADWQSQMTRCRRELGFRHVRFHGLMDDDMGTLLMQNNELVYSFFNADQICDFLLSIGMKPFMELSFMPSTLSSGDTTVFHYKGNVTPPRDYAAWGTLIEKLVGHWVDRYGIAEVRAWFFEVWNEPNLEAFWTGSREDYFRFYEMTHRKIKGIDPSLKVGGPATAGNAWISEFMQYCDAKGLSPDFISTHHYPTDAFGKPGDDTVSQLAASKRSVLRDQAMQVRSQAGDKPVYYTEWCTSSNPFDDLHDAPYAAAFIVKTIMEARNLVQGYSYWTFSDIFEENYFSSAPFHGGFGLMTINGIPKPSYRAFELLHRLGTELLATDCRHETVDAWLTRDKKNIQILVSNSALPRHPVKTETVFIKLDGAPEAKSAFLERIDDDHSNSRRNWEQLGSPAYLSNNHVHEIEAASALVRSPHPFVISTEGIQIEFTLPPQGVVLLTLEVA